MALFSSFLSPMMFGEEIAESSHFYAVSCDVRGLILVIWCKSTWIIDFVAPVPNILSAIVSAKIIRAAYVVQGFVLIQSSPSSSADDRLKDGGPLRPDDGADDHGGDASVSHSSGLRRSFREG
jgi:hypothetical protein